MDEAKRLAQELDGVARRVAKFRADRRINAHRHTVQLHLTASFNNLRAELDALDEVVW